MGEFRVAVQTTPTMRIRQVDNLELDGVTERVRSVCSRLRISRADEGSGMGEQAGASEPGRSIYLPSLAGGAGWSLGVISSL